MQVSIPTDDGWRFAVRLQVPAKVLSGYVKHRGHSVRTLAAAVADKTHKPCHHASVGHLMSGKRKSIGDDKARAIEKILDVPPGTFFAPSMSRVARDARGRAVA